MKKIEQAIEILKKGGLVIFPTDTAFGIGCRIDDEAAVKRLFAIRKRPVTQATPVLVDTVLMAQKYLTPISKEVVDKLVEPYWPGALTIVLPCKMEKVPSLVRGGGNTIGVRIPNHKSARALIQGVGVPILGPSANFHGEKTPYSFDDLDLKLVGQVDFVVDGICSVRQASTVIDCSKKPWTILRRGAVRISNEQKKNVVLLIDTSSNKHIAVGIVVDGKKYTVKKEIGLQKSQVVLSLIEDLLSKHHVALSELTAITVNEGPGSFTGLRVGASIANAFSFALQIPINGKKTGEYIAPSYS